MANKFLLPVYNFIFNEEFLYDRFDNRLKMQKAIYLLQEMGVPVSNYGFSWYKHGPYSQTLLDDAHSAHSAHSANSANDAMSLSSLSSDNYQALVTLKKILEVPADSSYSTATWSECVASLQYLRQNVLPRNYSDSDVLSELVRRKTHLEEPKTNNLALEAVKKLFA